MEKEELRENLTTRDTWMRGLYMLLFLVFYTLAELVVGAVVVFQFLSRLITGEVNERLLQFGQQLSRYLYDTLRFFTFNSEEKPYPFSPWPQTPNPTSPRAGEAGAVKKKSVVKKKAVAKKKSSARKSPTETDSKPTGEG